MIRQLSTFDIFAITQELQDLLGSHIDKIYHLSKDEVLIKIRNVQIKQKEYLYIKNEIIIARLQETLPTPLKPSTFAMTLRKYITNARITKIWQQPFDRILNIELTKNSIQYRIIIELFKNGNILFVNQDNKILIPLKRQHWSHRHINIGTQYLPPPMQMNPFELSKEMLQTILDDSTVDLVRTIAVELNFGGLYAEELLKRAHIQKNKKPQDLTKNEAIELYQTYNEFLNMFKKNTFNPQLIEKNDVCIDITPFPFKIYEHFTSRPVHQMVKGLETFIECQDSTKQISTKDTQIEKLKRMQKQQQQAIQSIEEKIIQKQKQGELIYLHFKECGQLLKTINSIMEQKEKTESLEQIKKHPLVKDLDMNSGTISVKLIDLNKQTHTVPLDIRKSTAENAENAYNMSKKQKLKLKGAQQALEKTTEKIRQREEHIEKSNQYIPEKKQYKKQFWFEQYRWFISSNNNIVIAGRDAKSNEQIVKKYLKPKDRYAHADIQGAPSCIIKQKTPEEKPVEINNKTVEEACIFASSYSKAWKQFTETQAYWVHPEQVSKTPQSGEFVPKGAFIIRGSRNYMKCILELGIGMVTIQDTKKLMAGPVSAIQNHCTDYIIIKPGSMKKNKIVEYIKDVFQVTTEEVQRILPPGNSMIHSLHGSLQQPIWMKKS